VAQADMTAEQAVLNYKRLAEVERAFRTRKGVDLQVRPIRHRLEARVKAHKPRLRTPQHHRAVRRLNVLDGSVIGRCMRRHRHLS